MPATIVWQRVEGALIGTLGPACAVALDAPRDVRIAAAAAVVVVFAPELAFAGCRRGRRVGAAACNAVHLHVSGAVLMATGTLANAPAVGAVGAVGLPWGTHAGFDRALGCGPKSADGFGIAHPGTIGAAQRPRRTSSPRPPVNDLTATATAPAVTSAAGRRDVRGGRSRRRDGLHALRRRDTLHASRRRDGAPASRSAAS